MSEAGIKKAQDIQPFRFVAPNGVSKSMAKALECEEFFAHQYLVERTYQISAPGNAAREGTIFHKWREDYIKHLVETVQASDPAYIETWIEANNPPEGVAALIRTKDINFQIDPQSVVGVEGFLSCDADLKPIDEEWGNSRPGKLSESPDVLASATIDVLLLPEYNRAVIVDHKSNFSTATVTDDEPLINCLVVFAHFTQVETIEFRWDFVRKKSMRNAVYTRADVPKMIGRVKALNQRKNEIVAKANAGVPLETRVGPLCPYCRITDCPQRQQTPATLVGPVQTFNDFQKYARIRYAIQTLAEQLDDAIRPYVDAHGDCQVEGDLFYSVKVGEGSSYPLMKTLNALGLAVLDITALPESEQARIRMSQPTSTSGSKWDVPLDSLTVGATKLNGYAKTKRSKARVSREGLAGALEQVANKYPRSRFVFEKKSQPPELIEMLQQSLDARREIESGDSE